MALRRIAVVMILLCPMFAESKKQETKLPKTKLPEAIQCCWFMDHCFCGPIPNPWCNGETGGCAGGLAKQNADPISNVERQLMRRDFREKREPVKIEGLLTK